MTLKEGKLKVLALIEELNPDNENLTDDPDISAKINYVFNQIMYEMARFKKIPRYVEMEVTEGDLIEFSDIERECGNEVYQIDLVGGIDYQLKANGTIIKVLSSGTAEIDCFVYPERITEKTKDTAYEFELSADALELLPYGVAGDLLKSDVSTQYGAIYTQEFERRLQRLDPRNNMAFVTIEGGVDI